MAVLERIKQHRLAASILTVAILGLLTFSIYGVTRPDGGKLVSEFEQAVNQGDTVKLLELVKPDKKEMTITEVQLKQLVAYAKKNPDYVKHLVFFMGAQAAIADNQGEDKSPNALVFQQYKKSEITNYGDFYIKKSNGIFPSYQIYARAHYLTVNVNEPDTVIEVAGKKVFTTEKDKLDYTYGPIMPGTYTVQGTKKFSYGDVTGKNEVDLFDVKEMKASTTLEIGKKINVVSTQDNVTIFINGEAVNNKAVKVKDPSSLTTEEVGKTFGPVSTDGTMEIQGEIHYPWGTVKTQPQTLTDLTTIVNLSPNPLATKQTQENVTKTINAFAQQSMAALVNKDPSVIKTANNNMINKYVEEIQFEKTLRVYWKGKALGTKIDFTKVSMEYTNGVYYATLPVEFHSQENQYGRYNDDGQPLQDVIDNSMVTLAYDLTTLQWNIVDRDTENFSGNFLDAPNVVVSEF